MLSNCGCVEITSLTFATSVSLTTEVPGRTAGWSSAFSRQLSDPDVSRGELQANLGRVSLPTADNREGPMMFVDSGLLQSGGNESRQAGEHVQQAAQHLSSADLLPRMFGDFAAAQEFHESTASLRVHHTQLLSRHRETLGAVGLGALKAAVGFAEMDENNAARVRAVRCNSAT
jgi:hypothetical protein